MLLGSRAFLTARMTSMPTSPISRPIKGDLAMPVPCSAVSVPPSSMVRSMRLLVIFRAFSQCSFFRGSMMSTGWMFPSPTWPKVAMGKSYSSPISWTALMIAGILVMGTPLSSTMGISRSPLIRFERAGVSPPRASQILSISCWSSVHTMPMLSCFSAMALICFM